MSTVELARIIEVDPALRQFFSAFSGPRYQYFARRSANRAYCWTVEPAKDDKGRMRYASWVSRLSKDYITPMRSTRRDHVRRSDAKARALKLYQEASHADTH